MNHFGKYQRWIYQAISILVLAGLLCANGMNYFLPTSNYDLELYELYDPVDEESETESENAKEDIDLKLKSQHLSLRKHYVNYLQHSFETAAIQPIGSLETPTPPPEYSLILL